MSQADRYEEEFSDHASGVSQSTRRPKGRPPSKRGSQSTRGGSTTGRGGRGGISAYLSSGQNMQVSDEVFNETSNSQSTAHGAEGVSNMETTPPRRINPPPPPQEQVVPPTGPGGSKRTVDERSPASEVSSRSVRQRLNEFDIGEAFGSIEDKIKESVKEVIASTPEAMKESMTKGLEIMMKSIHEVMNVVSDGVHQERLAREAAELSMEDKMERLEAKIVELQSTADSLTRHRVRTRTKESVKEMERKVTDAQVTLKMLEVDVGRETEDKREIVRRTIDEIRHYVREDDIRHFDRVMRRTRVIILGKKTSRWEGGGGPLLGSHTPAMQRP